MENLSNNQILEIINFYKECGISEETYLSSDGVLDIFSLLGIIPEFSETGERIPTVYELLEIPPQFVDEKEVPIVFAIKNRAFKVHKFEDKRPQNFTYLGQKESANASEIIILNKFKQDYFSAIANGNMIEATRLYDLIDKLTGGKADEFIGINYNCVKFYKKMQKQLLMDMFANFVILRVLSKQIAIKEGLTKLDKLYKEFEKELERQSFIFLGKKKIRLPKISKIEISTSSEEISQKVVVSNKSNHKKLQINNETAEANNVNTEIKKQNNSGLISFIKEKVSVKFNRLRDQFQTVNRDVFEPIKQEKILDQEKPTKILEND